MGLSMAAAAVEAASGQRWEDYLRDHVWRPFGMTHTGWTFQERTDARFAFGYDKGIAEHPIANKIAALDGADWNLKGNGGIQASANDMRRYYKGVMGQPKAVKDLMLTAHAKEEPGVLAGYGLAFRTDDAGKVYRIGHGGSDGVFFSYLAIYPEQNAFMYFVGNNGEEPVKDELKGVLKILQDAIGATPKPAS
jgi:CubicO group peptidase (beta-lactamase class C family)